MKTCICDKCGKEIEIDVQEEVIDRDKDGKEISEQFFVCPECGQKAPGTDANELRSETGYRTGERNAETL